MKVIVMRAGAHIGSSCARGNATLDAIVTETAPLLPNPAGVLTLSPRT